ncbi:MAG: efflux RND transporter periplasmic adaptor subunit [Verrucomicrobiota bacterium]|nr:efflux RND transporter periplasmic adaptor subunit [Verrucomicrobiota bacterium]
MIEPSLPSKRGILLWGIANLLLSLASLKADRAEDIVILDSTSTRHLGIETTTVKRETFEETLFALGRIEPMPEGHAYISSRIAGRILEENIHEGEWIQKGEPAVIVESLQPGEPPPKITLLAPIDGLVTKSLKHTGEPVTSESPILEIVDVRLVYAVAKIPEDKISYINEQTQVSIHVVAYPQETFTGTWERFGSEVDPESSTLEAFFRIEDANKNLRPSMRAEFTMSLSQRKEVMAVPREAIQGDHYQPHVFIKDFEIPDAFIKARVVTGSQNDQYVEIIRGLLPGDEVVTRGAYPLSFAGKGGISLKEALDAAHGHEHNEDGSEITQEQKVAKAMSEATPQGQGPSPRWVWFLGCLCVMQWILLAIKWGNRTKIS